MGSSLRSRGGRGWLMSVIFGWGRTTPSVGQVREVTGSEELGRIVAQPTPRGLVPRGLGRSYGDSAQNAGGVVLDLTPLAGMDLDAHQGQVTAEGGTSLDEVLRRIVPAGFFVPVSPGTRFVTVGGAIAADVHGKNHHVDGTFGSHVSQLALMTPDGATMDLTPEGSGSAAFWATLGGMGLTGVITRATFDVIPIETSRMRVDTDRFDDLDALMGAMIEGDKDYRYSVAWVDSLSERGRGVLTRGEHATRMDLPASLSGDPLAYGPRRRLSAPRWVPSGALNGASVRAFNEAWFRKAPRRRRGELQSIPTFFHPLDGVEHWNRIYGRRGFIQYQFAVPGDSAHVVHRVLRDLRQAGAPSFLTVLKRFGPGNPAPLSFPQPGWTLALDIPVGNPQLGATLDQLDAVVAETGGRVYLAKDSRMAPEMFERMYPRWWEWRAVRDQLDPDYRMASDQARRLGLLRPVGSLS